MYEYVCVHMLVYVYIYRYIYTYTHICIWCFNGEEGDCPPEASVFIPFSTREKTSDG